MQNDKKDNSGLLTTDEVAKYFQLNKSTVYYLARSGKVPAIKIGRQWRFHREHLESWMKGNMFQNDSLKINSSK